MLMLVLILVMLSLLAAMYGDGVDSDVVGIDRGIVYGGCAIDDGGVDIVGYAVGIVYDVVGGGADGVDTIECVVVDGGICGVDVHDGVRCAVVVVMCIILLLFATVVVLVCSDVGVAG